MKNILFIHDYPLKEGGGVEIQTYSDGITLSQSGFNVVIASTRVNSETFNSKVQNYPIEVNKNLKLENIESKEKLESLINKADIVQIQATFSLRSGMMGALRILNKLNKPYVIAIRTTINHLPFSRLAQLNKLESELLLNEFAEYLKSDLCTIIGVSECIQDSLDYLQVNKKIKIVHNAKDWTNFEPQGLINIEKVDVTYVGEVSWMKGLNTLVSALKILESRNINYKCRIVGNGQKMEDVKEIVNSLNMNSNIEFTGYVENKFIPNFLANTKVLVMPSLTESWGNIGMEALGLGTSLIASNTEGLIELTKNGELGLLFNRGDALDLSIKLELMLNDKETIKKYTNPKISSYIKENFNMQKRKDELIEVYKNIKNVRKKEKIYASY